MKVFLSWSGENSQSHQVAQALRDWLPSVIQQVKPWLSSHDIKTGFRWQAELNKQLADTRFGIFSITHESKDKPYLMFEAGALSRYVEEESYVCPYYFGLKPTDIKNPISEYQGVESNQEGTLKLCSAMNSALKKDALSTEKLNKSFAMWWPKLEDKLREIQENDANKSNDEPIKREDRELLEELLSLTRILSRSQNAMAHSSPAPTFVQPTSPPPAYTPSIPPGFVPPPTTAPTPQKTAPTFVPPTTYASPVARKD